MTAANMTASEPKRGGSISALTGLRGYAALWVLLSHISFTDSFSASLPSRLHWTLANGIIRHEYLAVDLFFVLSGFVLTHAHAKELDAFLERKTYVRFLLLRLARVYPLHLAALAWAAWILPPLGGNNLGTLILQLTMMASWGFTGGLTWNDPAWSLSSEWLAYLTLPLLIHLSAGLRRLRQQFAAIFALLLLSGFLYFGFMVSMRLQIDGPHFHVANGAGANARVLIGVSLGAVLRRLYDDPRVHKLPWTAIFWMMIPVAARCMSDLTGKRLENSLQAYVAIIVLVFAAACASPRGLLPFSARLPVYVGEISYAIYIFHYPVLLTLRAYLGRNQEHFIERSSPAEAKLVAVAAMLAVVAVAMVAHHAIERPMRRWARARIDKMLPGSA